MIGIGLIVLGCISIYLAIAKWEDYRNSRNDFAPFDDISGLHVRWKQTLKIQRFRAILDIWLFGIVGPAVIVGGVIALFRGD